MFAIPPVDGLTIGAALRRAAAQHPNREALAFRRQGFRATYAECDRQVDDVARALLALDIRRGDRVAVWAPNRPEWALVFLATARIGAVLVTVHPPRRSDELDHILRRSETKALFAVDGLGDADHLAMIGEVRPHLPTLRWVVTLRESAPTDLLTWPYFLGLGASVSRRELEAREAAPSPGDPTVLLVTSRTTGLPRGATLTHRGALLNAWYVGETLRLGPTDRLCVPTAFHHWSGVVSGLLGSVVRGATLLVPSEHFDAGAVLACVEEERATALYGVPSMFVAELEHEERGKRNLSSLRTGILVEGPAGAEVVRRVAGDLGVGEVTTAYGLAEASGVITQTRPDDPLEVHAGTVGRPLAGVQVRVVAPGTEEPLARGAAGELQARGHNVMLGYSGMPEATRETVLRDGWLRTGDLAILDEDGNVRIGGRMEDPVDLDEEAVAPREARDADLAKLVEVAP